VMELVRMLAKCGELAELRSVDPDTLPAGLEAIVNANPVSALVDASRGLMDGNAAGSDIAVVLATTAVLTAIFLPLTTHLYRTRA